MKANLRTSFYLLVICTMSLNHAAAQKRSTGSAYNYTTALGLGIDFGDGGTYVGPSLKYFFSKNNVGKAEVLFGDFATMLSLYYQYHSDIKNAPGLKGTLGLGTSVLFYNGTGDPNFGFRLTGGLDFKIPNVPIAMEFDWRPAFYVTEGTDVEAGRFGFGFRYCFK